jgi:hypothetical protein
MARKLKYKVLQGSIIFLVFLFVSCNTSKRLNRTSNETIDYQLEASKLSGGSSGMEQLTDTSYLVVYDLKTYKKGIRLGLIIVTDEAVDVYPIQVATWGSEGISSDLESICAIPGRTDEYLVAESGNWKGEIGRIFHIKVDIDKLEATVVSSMKYPLLHRNDFGITGDQYESIMCLSYTEKEMIVVIGERGGSQFSPTGKLRWAIWNIELNTLDFKNEGLLGVEVSAPGNWSNNQSKRSITDIHVDQNGTIWAAASEDRGDTGPFYSVIYKMGKINQFNPKNPVTIFNDLTIGREIYGFKIEALSGPKRGINCTHTFGTEDEIYGGVWRPINIASNN